MNEDQASTDQDKQGSSASADERGATDDAGAAAGAVVTSPTTRDIDDSTPTESVTRQASATDQSGIPQYSESVKQSGDTSDGPAVPTISDSESETGPTADHPTDEQRVEDGDAVTGPDDVTPQTDADAISVFRRDSSSSTSTHDVAEETSATSQVADASDLNSPSSGDRFTPEDRKSSEESPVDGTSADMVGPAAVANGDSNDGSSGPAAGAVVETEGGRVAPDVKSGDRSPAVLLAEGTDPRDLEHEQGAVAPEAGHSDPTAEQHDAGSAGAMDRLYAVASETAAEKPHEAGSRLGEKPDESRKAASTSVRPVLSDDGFDADGGSTPADRNAPTQDPSNAGPELHQPPERTEMRSGLPRDGSRDDPDDRPVHGAMVEDRAMGEGGDATSTARHYVDPPTVDDTDRQVPIAADEPAARPRRAASVDAASLPSSPSPDVATVTGDVATQSEPPVVSRETPTVAPMPSPSSTRIMVVANQKGGVGKTTTAVNLAAALALGGLSVLVVDLDPQGNASTALGIDHPSGTRGTYEVLIDGDPIAAYAVDSPEAPRLQVLPATVDLAGAEIELVSVVARENRLKRALKAYLADHPVDYVLIDCPPSLGLLTINALVAAREVLIPIQCEYYALEGVSQLMNTVDLVMAELNEHLVLSTVLLTMFDARTRLAAQVADEVRAYFAEQTLPTVIPRSVRISEAPSYGQTVLTYHPDSAGAVCYLEAAREIAHRGTKENS